MDTFILLLGKVFFRVHQSANGSCQVIAAVADTFQFGNLAHHVAYLRLSFVAQVSIAHGAQILGNLLLHVVGYGLIFLYPCVKLHKLRVVAYANQLAYHTKHTLNTLCKARNLFVCFEHREFGRLHDASLNEAQTEVFFLVFLARLDNPAYNLLYLRYEPDKYSGIKEVEKRVESR